MKRRIMRSLIVLFIAALAGSALQVLAQPGAVSPEQMEMMKKMMMNRPASMRTADEAIQGQKKQAASQDKYGCCLKQACDHCALKMGECPCRMNLEKKMAVCNECKGGWHAGDGAVPGVNADEVTTLPRMADMGRK